MKSLFKTVALITAFSILTRALGFFFRIYLSRVLGAEALGVYQVSMSIFMVLLAIVSSGLPLVISKLSAELRVKNKKIEEFSMVTSALIIGIISSIILCGVVLIFYRALGAIFTDERCIILLLIMLPAVLFSSVYSTFRGSLWGHSNFFAVCLSELFEQVMRIIICVILFAGIFSISDKSIWAGVAMTIACALSAVFVTILYFIYGGKLKKSKEFTKSLIKSSLPITGVRVASSLIQPVIAIIVPMRLVASGLSTSASMSLFGIAMGMALPFLFIPSTLIGSLSMALIPDISSAKASNNEKHISNRVLSSVMFTLFISFLFLPLYLGAGEHIGTFFYANSQSGTILGLTAWVMIPIGLVNITSSMLNALGLELKSFRNYVLGAILMLLSIWFLPKYIGIYAVSVGMGLCMGLASILNIRMINKHTNNSLRIIKPICLFIICCLPVTALVSFCTNILVYYMPLFFNLAISCSIGALSFVLLSIIFNIVDFTSYVSAFKNNKIAKCFIILFKKIFKHKKKNNMHN